MKVCSNKQCDKPSIYKIGGGRYCRKHHRFIRMRNSAKLDRKQKPTFEELETFLKLCGEKMKCPNCNRKMIWHSSLGKRGDVVSLQHNNDGTMQFLCSACNSIHGNCDLGDGIFKLNKKQQYCCDCKKILDKKQFWKCSRHSTGVSNQCKQCKNKRRIKLRNDRRNNKLCIECGDTLNINSICRCNKHMKESRIINNK